MAESSPGRARRPSRSAPERLRAAAMELFAERGYAASGVSAICERAGVAKTALYWHFGSKEGLLAVVLEEVTAASGIARR
jgi:AcrR family transcriptional regulator